MATARDTNLNQDIQRLQVLIANKKEEVEQQFNLLRTNLARKEQSLCSELDDILTTAVNSYKGLYRSIKQLELGQAKLENTLKENHVLGVLEKTVVDINKEKQRLLQQNKNTPKIVQLLWNLEPFLREVENLCMVKVSYNSGFDNKVVRLNRAAGEGFGFVIMSDLRKETTICRINGNSPAHNSQLQIGDIITELNGQDVTNCTHLEIVEKIMGLRRISLSVRRISNELHV